MSRTGSTTADHRARAGRGDGGPAGGADDRLGDAPALGGHRIDLLTTYDRHVNPSLARLLHAAGCPVEHRAVGGVVVDETGGEHLDFGTGHGIFGLGHCRPEVRASVMAALDRFPSNPPVVTHGPARSLVRELNAVLPAGLPAVRLAGSGSEAVELALAAALSAGGGRPAVVAAGQGYHGKTLGALGVTGMAHLRQPFEPLLPDVRHVPFGDPRAVERALADGQVAAVVIEPVLGGGTVQVPPPGYLAAVRVACRRRGTWLVADEVQTGLGRTGRMFGCDHDGVVPDALVLSKTLTGGHASMAAVALAPALAVAADDLAAGPGGERYGPPEGHATPAACAAAATAVRLVHRLRLADRSAVMGEVLAAELRAAADAHPDLVVGTPGIGLMRGLAVRNRAVEHALWLQLVRTGVVTGLSFNARARRPVLRVYPPMTVSADDIDRFADALRRSLQAVRRGRPRWLLDLANQAMRTQFALPRRAQAAGVRLLAPPARGGRR